MAPHKKNPAANEIALERIEILFTQAHKNRDNPDLANRYVALAREIAMRRRLRMPRKYRHSFCPACHAYFVPGQIFVSASSTGKSSPPARTVVP